MNNLYDTMELERKIDRIAELNEGEVPEALFNELMAEQMKSVTQIENLVQYIRQLDLGVEMCDAEINRIDTMKSKANKRIESIKSYITPYVKQQGKVIAGTFTLTTHKSKSVNIIDETLIPDRYIRIIPKKEEPDKNMIKKDLKSGICVPGAELQENNNLQIK